VANVRNNNLAIKRKNHCTSLYSWEQGNKYSQDGLFSHPLTCTCFAGVKKVVTRAAYTAPQYEPASE